MTDTSHTNVGGPPQYMSGDTVRIEVVAMPDHELNGVICRIEHASDTGLHTIKINGHIRYVHAMHLQPVRRPEITAEHVAQDIADTQAADVVRGCDDVDVPRTLGAQVEAMVPHYDQAIAIGLHIDPMSPHGRRLRGLAIMRLIDGFVEYGHALFEQSESELVREEDEELADFLNRRAWRISLGHDV